MPRTKRGKQVAGGVPRQEIARAEGRSTGKEYRQAFCPVCGVSHGLKRLEYPSRGYWEPPPTMNYWEWIKDRDDGRGIDAAEHFGVIQEVGGGKGHSFRVLGYFGPEDDQDGYYPLVKARLLCALRRWVQNGWLTTIEIQQAIENPEDHPAIIK